jgi:tropomyosin
LTQLRAEADAAIERAEQAEAKNKTHEQQILQLEQENKSLQHRLNLLEGQLENSETQLQDSKKNAMEGEQSKQDRDGLQRKVQLLEEELDAAEKNLKETVEKYAFPLLSPAHYLIACDQTKAGRRKGGAL